MKELLAQLKVGLMFVYNDDGLIIGYNLMFGDSENHFSSDPIMFEWPIQHLPIPDSMKGMLN